MDTHELEQAIRRANAKKDMLFDSYLAAYKEWADLSVALLEAKLSAPPTDLAPGGTGCSCAGADRPNPGAGFNQKETEHDSK